MGPAPEKPEDVISFRYHMSGESHDAEWSRKKSVIFRHSNPAGAEPIREESTLARASG